MAVKPEKVKRRDAAKNPHPDLVLTIALNCRHAGRQILNHGHH
jgi:hypothetical protein